MNNNLVPKVITDRNGVTTTRWTKPDQSPSLKALPQVQPLLPASPLAGVNRTTLLHDLYAGFERHGDDNEDYFDDICKKLKSLPDHSLRIITSFIVHDGDYDGSKVVYAAEVLMVYEGSTTDINEILHYFDAFSDGTSNLLREEAISKLKKCVEIPYAEDYTLVEATTQTEIRRLLKLAGDYYGATYDPDDSNHNIIVGEKMRSMIRDNQHDEERLEQINALMIERQTEDHELILSILDSDTPAISSGLI